MCSPPNREDYNLPFSKLSQDFSNQNGLNMIGFLLLIFIIALNLINVITEKTIVFYKDIRFWLVLISLALMIILSISNYPI